MVGGREVQKQSAPRAVVLPFRVPPSRATVPWLGRLLHWVRFGHRFPLTA
jgi:hypothetical protein